MSAMKRFLFMMAVSIALLSGCGTSSTVSYYDYKAQVIHAELDGSYVIRACGKGRNAAQAMAQAQKAAVYEVVFNGVSASSPATQHLKPLLLEVNAQEKYQDYFNDFFADGGAYTEFYTIQSKRLASSNFRRNRQMVQCLTNVNINVPALKKRLKEDNIIK